MGISNTIMFIIIIYLVLKYRFGHIRNKYNKYGNILLLIAHPDDELFFFYPFITTHKKIFILCLSSGNYYSMGSVRRIEMRIAAKLLGFSYRILNFKDNEDWNISRIIYHLDWYCYSRNIDSIFTFGKNGVTGHKNHISCHKAVKHYDADGIQRYYLREFNFFSKWIYFSPLFWEKGSYIDFSSSFKSLLMIFIYSSQMEWYRILNLLFSNYLCVNYFDE